MPMMKRLALLFVLTLGGALTSAQSPDPSTLPLLQPTGIQHLGAFRVPDNIPGGDISYGGNIIAFNPATNSLFISSRDREIAEMTIPTPVRSSDVKALPYAKYIQAFADPSEGHWGPLDALGQSRLYGIHVAVDRMTVTAGIYYDANNTQQVTHFSRSTTLAKPSFSGWSQVWEDRKAGYVAGGMAHVPVEWQAKLGGPAITGQSSIPITTRTSQGPSAFAFDPAQIGQAKVRATPLLYYPPDHPTLGPWSGSNPTFGATTEIRGMVIVAGTRTALYFGRNGIGPYCYGNGTADKALAGKKGSDGEVWCYDPTNSGKSQHAYPYNYQIWAYDLNDFAAVKAGKKKPWEIVPYGVWPLSIPIAHEYFPVGGLTYDPQRQIIYFSQPGADTVGNLASVPVIHAFKVDVPPQAPLPTPKPAPVPTPEAVPVTVTTPTPTPVPTATPVPAPHPARVEMPH
jgi:hypothetical protein